MNRSLEWEKTVLGLVAWRQRLRLLVRSPQFLLIGGFAAVIWTGTILLWLPWSHQPGQVGFLAALFTATSAVCVTGLIVVDTATAYTPLGQTIIALLIQTGGLGVMTFAALTFRMLGRRLSLQSQMILHDSFFQQDIGADFRHLFRQILLTTAAIEISGSICLAAVLLAQGFPWPTAMVQAAFHSISAFCNAGFSLFTDNLVGFKNSPVFQIIIMGLIISGGLGHGVLLESWQWLRQRWQSPKQPYPRHPLSTHAQVVWRVSLLLIGAGAILLYGCGLTPAETGATKILAALFQSVTARTAGFNTVDIGALPLSSLLVLIVLMFIGGSPGSCAGGVKTTSLAVWLAEMRAKLRGEREVNLLGRQVPSQILWRNTILIRLAALWNLGGVLLLSVTEAGSGAGLHDLLFEQVSAFGTVGLSTGLTPRLSIPGQLWIILTMFLGRVGPLTIAMWIIPERHVGIRYPQAKIMIG